MNLGGLELFGAKPPIYSQKIENFHSKKKKINMCGENSEINGEMKFLYPEVKPVI